MVRERVLLEGFPLVTLPGLECVDAGIYIAHGELAEGLDEPAPADQVEGKHVGPADADTYGGPLLCDEFRDQGRIFLS